MRFVSSAFFSMYLFPLQQSPEFLSFVNSATAYVNLTALLGSSQAASLQSEISASLQSSSSQVPSSYNEVIQGYQAIFNVTSNSILPSEVGAVEMLLSTTSSGVVVIQAALQHPLRLVLVLRRRPWCLVDRFEKQPW